MVTEKVKRNQSCVSDSVIGKQAGPCMRFCHEHCTKQSLEISLLMKAGASHWKAALFHLPKYADAPVKEKQMSAGADEQEL